MANENIEDKDNVAFSFLPETPKFGTDNCATHHVCNDQSFFVGEILPMPNIGIRGVGCVAVAAGIGTIIFFIDFRIWSQG